MRKLSILLFSILLALSVLSSCKEKETEVQAPEPSKAVNVIYMIGDGMSLPQIYATMLASDKDLAFTEFPYSGIVITKSASNDITDSAAAGTALACGGKTRNGMVGMTPDSIPMRSVLDVLAENGKTTGIVVTCYATHATPAAFYAKVPARNQYETIAEQMMNCDNLNVIIGGGRRYFNLRNDGRDLFEEMTQKGWKVYDTLANIDVTNKKYAVLVEEEHLPVISERGDFLPRGVKTALETLDGSENGFFLMVEGSLIDMACHNNDSAYMVGEVKDFSDAIQVALDYTKTHENTLLVVTADHETGGLSLRDPKGHYNNPCMAFSTGSHTCLPVMVFAYGPSAEQFTGWMENSDLKGKILNACGITENDTISDNIGQVDPVKANFDSSHNK